MSLLSVSFRLIYSFFVTGRQGKAKERKGREKKAKLVYAKKEISSFFSFFGGEFVFLGFWLLPMCCFFYFILCFFMKD